MSKQEIWTRQQIFDPARVRKMEKTRLPLRVRLMLPLLANRYAVEGKMVIRYKRYRGVTYILGVKA